MKRFFAASVACAFTLSSAHAQTSPAGGAGSKPTDGIYLGFGLGAYNPTRTGYELENPIVYTGFRPPDADRTRLETDVSGAFNVVVGTRLAGPLSIEFEGSSGYFRIRELEIGDNNLPLPRSTGSFEMLSANLLVDKHLGRRARIYVGGGGGLSIVSFDEATYGFGYQAKAGFDYRVAERRRLGFEIAYAAAGDTFIEANDPVSDGEAQIGGL